MLKLRVIPTLLWKNLSLVKGIGFESWRQVGTVLPSIKVYNTRDVDELILLDILCTKEKRIPDYQEIAELSAECFVPLTIGGGVNSIETIRNLLKAGADKITVNTFAYERPELIKDAANHFGSQCIVASIDARLKGNGQHECFSHCGSIATGKEPGEWAKELESLGAGEILITSIDYDGTMNGYDVELLKRVTNSVNIPVIASGGAGNPQHMLTAIESANVNAVSAASMFHFTEQTPREIKEFLAKRGIPVRNSNIKESLKW